MERKTCPYCGEEIAATAKKCRFCGEWLEDVKTTEPVTEKTVGQDVNESKEEASVSITINCPSEEPSHTDNYSSESETAGKIYYRKKIYKIIFLSLAAVFLVLAICTFNVPLEFNWFVESCKYYVGFGILSLISLVAFAFSFGEQRDGKIYLNKDGKLDIVTPRSYEALKKPAIVRFIGRSHPFKGEGLQTFEYNDGAVSITTNKGNYISGPLSELTWKYSMTKPKDADDWHIYKYTLTDSAGNSVTFYLNKATFDDNEWDDINMLLSLCGTVDEGKISKMNKKMFKALEIIDGADFSDIPGSVIDIAADHVFDGTNKVIDLVKVKLYGKNKKKKGKFREILGKIWEWILTIAVVLYVLAVAAYNIVALIEYLRGSSNRNPIEQIDNEELTTATVAESQDNIYHLTGRIDGKYGIDMTLNFGTATGSYYYTKYSPDNTLRLVVTGVEGNKIVIEEYNDNNEHTGLFEGTINNDEISGWYTNYQGKEMPFFLKADNVEVDDYSAGDGEGMMAYIKRHAKQTDYYNGLPEYNYVGDFISGDSEFPVEFTFLDGDSGWFAVYQNTKYQVELVLEISEMGDDEMTLVNDENDFTVTLRKGRNGELTGKATQAGSSTLKVKLKPYEPR